MAPRSQEPQVIIQQDKKYIATITFTVDTKDKGTICYIFEGNRNSISQMATEQFQKDFPIEGIGMTISVAEVKDESLQKATDKKKILKLIERYLNYQDDRGNNKKIKFMGELTPINKIKEYYGFTIKETKAPIIEETPIMKVPQMPKQEKVAATVKATVKSWFCEYNIKLGTEKFRKGTKIDGADNEVDARKQLDVYIKRTFSKIRSITKVSIKEWEGESDFSEEIIESLPKAKEILQPKIETSKRTLDDIIKTEFEEDMLNERVFLVVLKHGKIKPKDFENDFFVKKDEGQTDEELFQEFKSDCPGLKRKHVGIRRGTFKQVLTTNFYKKILMGKDFSERIEKGELGIEALNEIIQTTYETVVTELDTKSTIEDKTADWFTTMTTVLPISIALLAEIIKNKK